MQAHMGNLEHVARTERIPGIHATILAEGDVDAFVAHLLDTRQAAPLGIGVVAALQHDVDQGVGDGRESGRLPEDRQAIAKPLPVS